MASEYAVKKYNLVPIAQVKGYADASVEPSQFTIAPSVAIPKSLSRSGITIESVDLFELNEAFSVVAIANCKILGIDLERVNLNGGILFYH